VLENAQETDYQVVGVFVNVIKFGEGSKCIKS
jgi:hypothetical protein